MLAMTGSGSHCEETFGDAAIPVFSVALMIRDCPEAVEKMPHIVPLPPQNTEFYGIEAFIEDALFACQDMRFRPPGAVPCLMALNLQMLLDYKDFLGENCLTTKCPDAIFPEIFFD